MKRKLKYLTWFISAEQKQSTVTLTKVGEQIVATLLSSVLGIRDIESFSSLFTFSSYSDSSNGRSSITLQEYVMQTKILGKKL
jgi:hypothetical protein